MLTTETERGRALGLPTMTLECYKCGIQFKVPDMFYRAKKSDHSSFHCPAGHGQFFTPGKSDEDIQRDRANRLDRQLASEQTRHAQTRAGKRDAENRERAQKGAKTRLKNQIAQGKCPCCNKVYKSLAKHMKKKHPEFEKENQ